MKITKSQLLKVIKEEIDKELKSDMEKSVLDTLSKEGGAAGLDPLVKTAKEVQPGISKEDIEALLKKMKKVVQHRDGDYIKEEAEELEEAGKSFDKDKMKCNKKRYIRKGETGHGKKQKVVKACDKGKERIVKFGDAKMRNNKDKKKNRKNFRSRMNCDEPGSKLKARYWACKDW
jgi:hypothetical protein